MAIKAGVGLSTAKDHIQAVKEAINDAKKSLEGGKINLAIIFSSVEFAHPIVLKTAANILGEIPIIGCSSLAVICNQGIFKHALLIGLFCLSDGVQANCGYVKNINEDAAKDGEELGEKLLFGFKGFRRDVGVIFSDGMISDISGLINGIQGKLGSSFPLLGACASDNPGSQHTYVYFYQETTSNAACGILWGGKLHFSFGIKHGWKPLGKPHLVTSSSENIVQEIDNRPAIKIYEEYFGKTVGELKEDLKHISIFYPIGIKLPGEEEYLLRTLLSINDDGSLLFQGNIPQDSPVRLMIGTREACLSATRQALSEAKKDMAGPDFVLVFNSLSRYMLLGRDAGKELEIIKEGLNPDTPIMGLYTFGEQAPLKAIDYRGKSYFHNQSINILSIEGY